MKTINENPTSTQAGTANKGWARIKKAALDLLKAGFSVIPIKTDGSKSPSVVWKRFQTRLATKKTGATEPLEPGPSTHGPLDWARWVVWAVYC